MKMKKVLATVLATTLACGILAGCGSSAPGTQDTADTAKKDGEGKVVRVFQLKVEINDAWQA